MAKDRRKAEPEGRGSKVFVYVTPSTRAALVRLAGEETVKRGERVSVSGLVGEWIEERIARKGAR